MTSAGVRLQQFQDDIESIAAHYLDEAGVHVALRFVDELEILLRRLAEHPNVGSTTYARIGISDLRSMGMSGFPYVVFYAQRRDDVFFWRVLHARRDLPATLRQSDAAGLADAD